MADETAIKAWYAIRTKAIHERVTAHDILRRNGVSFRHTGDREEQFSCPFHGKDENPSARVYPSSPRSPSHVWCFVCRERWDVIALWKKYSGGENKSFHRLLSELEKLYGIETPAVPEGAFDRGVSVSDQDKHEFERLYGVCELRLKGAREDYVRLADMNGYLVAGSILDKVYYQVGEGTLTHRDGLNILNRLMVKIGERVRGVQIH
jgi:hypothetical protein